MLTRREFFEKYNKCPICANADKMGLTCWTCKYFIPTPSSLKIKADNFKPKGVIAK